MSLKVVIVGGVAGGATAAARARRLSEEAQIVLLERGEYISFANCGLPYYIGGEIPERGRLLLRTPEDMAQRYRIDVRTRSEVVWIDPDAREVEVIAQMTGQVYRESYDKLVLSPGAVPVRPPIPGADLPNIFVLRDIPDTDAIKARLEEGTAHRAVVVGGGFIGLEMAENLRRQGLEVAIVEMLDQVMPPLDYEMAALLHRHLVLNGVELHLKDSVRGFARGDQGKIDVTLQSGKRLACDFVALGVGVRPESDLAKSAGLELGVRGAIKVNAHLQSSKPDIYAIGDAIEVTDFVTGEPTLVPLAGPTNRQARIVVDHIFGRDARYPGTLGSAIVRVFDLTAATTGSNEKSLKRRGIAYHKSFVHPLSHADYFPHAAPMSLKLLFAPADGKILGAQIVGSEGVDKRIDVLATAIRAGMTVYDLEHLELAYAPPYNSVRDPVNVAGSVAANILRKDVAVVQWEEMPALDPDRHLILDVRTPPEFAAGHIPGALNIPVDELRGRLDELPPDKAIVAYCKVGLRGYLAARILTQKGFDVKNLSGGYQTYQAALEQDPPEQNGFARPREAPKSPGLEKGNERGMPTQEISTKGMDPPGPGLNGSEKAEVELDACGMQCPGPIVSVSRRIDSLEAGQLLRVSATDPGFASDLPAWCHATANPLISLDRENGRYVATIRKGARRDVAAGAEGVARGTDKTIIVFSNDLDRVMAAFIIANGAAAMGRKVTLFFTFWGLNVLRRGNGTAMPVKKSFMERIFGAMMPKGTGRLGLSKMNLYGMGARMMKRMMRQKKAFSLEELVEQARKQGVKLVACAMSMEIMGIKQEELIDGVEMGGVAAFLDSAERANMSLFI
ncbi:MAG: FAD-dependent oxidoreductase [Candidatus Tectomicrobia bacterium]|uniref:FAD-dependent oxidoreductase n=1 Tax=Tectimicrobiota bacterium TaxID=2528274 RepID=A0A932CMG8_UNCTE|nr:FAD-dependent oxidoreductase [Candidatus Tectomicrobia bacterium]